MEETPENPIEENLKLFTELVQQITNAAYKPAIQVVTLLKDETFAPIESEVIRRLKIELGHKFDVNVTTLGDKGAFLPYNKTGAPVATIILDDNADRGQSSKDITELRKMFPTSHLESYINVENLPNSELIQKAVDSTLSFLGSYVKGIDGTPLNMR